VGAGVQRGDRGRPAGRDRDGRNSSLSYDATTGRYTDAWKTDKARTGRRQLTVGLADGTDHAAYLQFTK
jgi:hypothetical protein